MNKKLSLDKDYENYRWFFTSNDVLVIGGKSDEQNEIVLKKFLRPEYTIMHTSAPGSSFMIIQSEKPTKKDLDETAVFTACFSKQWKNSSSDIEIDIFKGSQIYKTKSMNLGTFGVKGDKKTVKVKPELVFIIQKGKFRAVPNTIKEKVLAEIKRGNLSKQEAAEKIAKKIRDKFNLPVSREEIMRAIPSDRLGVK
jgi:hypothetical protein